MSGACMVLILTMLPVVVLWVQVHVPRLMDPMTEGDRGFEGEKKEEGE